MEQLTNMQLLLFMVSQLICLLGGIAIGKNNFKSERLPYVLLLLREYRRKHKLNVHLVFNPDGSGSLSYYEDDIAIHIFGFENVYELIHNLLVSMGKKKPK